MRNCLSTILIIFSTFVFYGCGKNGVSNTFIECVPESFFFNEFEYKFFLSSSTNDNKDKIGYLINEKDLNKWKNIDSSNCVYAIDVHNTINRETSISELVDRYELYLYMNDYNYLAVKISVGDFSIYERKTSK